MTLEERAGAVKGGSSITSQPQHATGWKLWGRMIACNSWNFIHTAPYKTSLRAGLLGNLGGNILRLKRF